MSTIIRSDKLDFFVFVLYGYANTRTSNSSNTRDYGYSHATSIVDAVKQHKGWKKNLTSAYDVMPECDKDLSKIRLAFSEFLAENRYTVTPEFNKYAEAGLNIAAGLEDPERPLFLSGLPDDYRDDLQPQLDTFNFN